MKAGMMFRKLSVALIAVGCGLPGMVSAADPIPVEAFARNAEFEDLQLSPDGTMVAALLPGYRNGRIVVLKLPKFEVVGGVQFENEQQVAQFWWVGDRQLVAELGLRDGPLDPVGSTGDLVTFGADGRGQRYVIGQQGAPDAPGTRVKSRALQRVFATVIDPLVDDPGHVMIASTSIDAGENGEAVVAKLDLETSHLEKLAVAPAAGAMEFLLDAEHRVRFASVDIDAFRLRTWTRSPEQGPWTPLDGKDDGAAVGAPLAMSADGTKLYRESEKFGPLGCLVAQVLATGEQQKLACHDAGSLSRVIRAFVPNGRPIAAVFEAGKPEIQVLDDAGRDGELLKLLVAAFPGKDLYIASVTRDGSKALVFTRDDRTPGDYYLFDTRTQKADYLIGLQVWLDPERMAERRPIALKARDGTPLHGYLTLPPGSNGKGLPLVVNPHGGPLYVRHDWSYDRDAQLLASRGYAVLQVNFRGSSGYGSAFIKAGRKAWATTMIDDITDATRWVIEQGYADPKRVCIYGASYGGYAALMSAVREPALYRCAIGYAGVYDLKLWRADSDASRSLSGRRYIEDAIAGSAEEMVAASPIHYLDRLKAPVLIVHGEADRRTPFSQAKALRSEMKSRNLPFEWLAKPGEGHGFIEPKNIAEFYTTMLGFLDRQIGASAVLAADAAAPAAVAEPAR